MGWASAVIPLLDTKVLSASTRPGSRLKVLRAWLDPKADVNFSLVRPHLKTLIVVARKAWQRIDSCHAEHAEPDIMFLGDLSPPLHQLM